MATCETCRFWVDMRSVDRMPHAGVCCRNPPMPVTSEYAWRGASYLEADRASAVWPCTDTDDWCGEHQPKEAGNAE